MPCDDATIVAALHEEAEIITDITYQKIEESDNFMLRMIPDGGTVERHSNQDAIIYNEARQAPTAYKEADYSVRPLVEGEMRGRKETGTSGIFEVDINDMDENACHGSCVIDFAQGYRRRGTKDYKIDLTTPEKCVREFDRFGLPHIRGYFEGMRRQFTRYGTTNFSDNLMNLVIQQSEANASVMGPNEFNVTSGGWEGPPQYRISIHFLIDYKEWIETVMEGLGFDRPSEWLMTVEMPREDWIEAVKRDQLEYNPTGTQYPIQFLTDSEGPMRNRESSVYRGIKCVFNESPIRGYFKPTSAGNWQFVRVYKWYNVQDEEAGLVTRGNQQYRADTIVVDGISYPMCTLIPHVHPESFRRFRLMKPLKPIGSANDGVNYNVKVLDGSWIPCNDHNDKFRLVARHEFRLLTKYPEFSGFIAYRHGRRAGYAIGVVPRDYTGPSDGNAVPQPFETCAPDPCSQAGCAQCGEVPDNNLQCVQPDAAPGGVLNLSPAGPVNAVFLGEAFDITFEVLRTGDPSSAASVNWASAHVTTSNADFIPGTGTLSWEPGDNSPKYITISILATMDDAVNGTPDVFTVTLSGVVGDTLGSGTVATVSLADEAG